MNNIKDNTFCISTSGFSIKETDHPAITICSQGYSETILAKSVLKQITNFVLSNSSLRTKYGITKLLDILRLTKEAKDIINKYWREAMYPGLEGSVKNLILSLVSPNLAKIQMASILSRRSDCQSGLKKCESGWIEKVIYENGKNKTLCIRDIGESTFDKNNCSEHGAKRLYASTANPHILTAFKDHIRSAGK